MITSPPKRKLELESINPEPYLTNFAYPAGDYRRDWYKRAFDITVLVVAHVALFPVFLLLWSLIPLAIWLEDRGPIFYVQRRVGKDGRVFNLLKFRSMVVDAESMSGPVWATDEDPRVTRVGRLLRARALDELPQIINVWKGDLSLVGPRPERPELVAQFSQEIPTFLKRVQVRPGLTGIAQVFGRYSTRPRDKLRYDVLYIDKLSPWLDIKLIATSAIVSVLARWQVPEKHIGRSRKTSGGKVPGTGTARTAQRVR